MEGNNNDQKKLWRLIFIIADVILLLALLIGFYLMRSKSSRSQAELSSEIGSVREQLSSIATDQEALSEGLASLQESVATAEVSDEIKAELSSLQTSYESISSKVDSVISALEQTEAESAMQEDLAAIKKQNEENKSAID